VLAGYKNEEIELYMLRDRVEDSVLNKAIEVIKENRVAGMIESSTVLSKAKKTIKKIK